MSPQKGPVQCCAEAAELLSEDVSQLSQFSCKCIPTDSSSLFRAVSESLFGTQTFHRKLRDLVASYMQHNKEKFSKFVTVPFDQYIHRLRYFDAAGGQPEMNAMEQLYRCDFSATTLELLPVLDEPPAVVNRGAAQRITLLRTPGNTYHLLVSRAQLEASAAVQSILYELLYEKVFAVRRAAYLAGLNQIAQTTADPRVSSYLSGLCWELERAFSHYHLYNSALSCWLSDIDGGVEPDEYEPRALLIGDRCLVDRHGAQHTGYVQKVGTAAHEVFVERLASTLTVPVSDVHSLGGRHQPAPTLNMILHLLQPCHHRVRMRSAIEVPAVLKTPGVTNKPERKETSPQSDDSGLGCLAIPQKLDKWTDTEEKPSSRQKRSSLPSHVTSRPTPRGMRAITPQRNVSRPPTAPSSGGGDKQLQQRTPTANKSISQKEHNQRRQPVQNFNDTKFLLHNATTPKPISKECAPQLYRPKAGKLPTGVPMRVLTAAEQCQPGQSSLWPKCNYQGWRQYPGGAVVCETEQHAVTPRYQYRDMYAPNSGVTVPPQVMIQHTQVPVMQLPQQQFNVPSYQNNIVYENYGMTQQPVYFVYSHPQPYYSQ